LSLRGGTTKQSQGLGDHAIASFRFATYPYRDVNYAMTIGHFFTWITLNALGKQRSIGWVLNLLNVFFNSFLKYIAEVFVLNN
jgi:hypothetical protein